MADSKDNFLLSLMRLLALAENGHTRVIPNDAISVFPLRFVVIGAEYRLVSADQSLSALVGGTLDAINGVSIAEFEAATGKYLAGTRQRKRVIGPILTVWPAALKRLGLSSGNNKINYTIRKATGQVEDLQMDTKHLVAGSTAYPRNEHGRADAAWFPTNFVKINDAFDAGTLLTLPSFFDPSERALSDAVSAGATIIKSLGDEPLIIDVRGNTGGDFLRTMPLIDAISDSTNSRRVGIIVDKFTFSAAIVFVAILKHRLGKHLVLIGEEMGDNLTFHAEGGLLDLPHSGGVVRFSSAFHDWASGRVDETTPTEIAEQIVSVGSLEPDRHWAAQSTDAELPDPFFRTLLESLRK